MAYSVFQRLALPATLLGAGFLIVVFVYQAKLGLSVPTLSAIQIWQYVFLGVLAAVVAVGIVYHLSARYLLEIFFTLAAFLGVWFACFHLAPLWLALLLSSSLTLGHLFIQRVVVRDLFFMVGAAGTALILAGWLPAEVLIVGLAGFTIYDMVGEPSGDRRESLVARVSRYGIVSGFVFPETFSESFLSLDTPLHSRDVLFALSDFILPLSLVALAAFTNISAALMVLLGAFLGSCILLRRTDLHPRQAFAPLAVGAIIPFLILNIINQV